MEKKRLGDVLLEHGSLSRGDLDRTLVEQQGKGVRLGEMLLESGLLSKADIAAALEEVSRVGYVECPPPTIAPDVLALIPPHVALRCCALPLERKVKKLVVAMAEPQNLEFLNELLFSAGMEISPRFSFCADILAGIKRFYDVDGSSKATEKEETEDKKPGLIYEVDTSEIEFITVSSREMRREAQKELLAGMQQRTPAVRLVSSILAAAASKKASDIHIEPHDTGTIIRLRVDGILRELLTVPAELQASVISRVKILADLDIAERRVPQDGRFLMQYRGDKIDLRVSTMPTHYGEKVALRLLDPSTTQVSFEQLGLSKEDATAFTEILTQPQGIMLVSGPTGSGKSTTLYAALNFLRSPSRNIITVEDPIEYMLEGINQVQVNPRAGLTFANCLRSILRQDPNVIMVGEIRDGETAEIALKATQTGHLVLSTLHTNDSIAAIFRLIDLSIPRYLVALAVTGVMAQRLVRTLCYCRKRGPTTSEHMERLRSAGIAEIDSTMYQPVGCPACDHTGYKGRVGIYELLLFDDQIRSSIHSSARPEEIRSLARAAGFKTMQEAALEKVKEGLTTLDEVLRVVPFETTKTVCCHACSRELTPAFLYCPFCGTGRGGADSTSKMVKPERKETKGKDRTRRRADSTSKMVKPSGV